MEEINPFQSSDAGLWYSLPLRQVLQSSIRVARHTVLASDDCFCFHPLISEQFQFWLEVCWGRGGGGGRENASTLGQVCFGSWRTIWIGTGFVFSTVVVDPAYFRVGDRGLTFTNLKKRNELLIKVC